MKPVFLTTDILFLGLIAMGLLYGWYAHRHEHLSEAWSEVRRNKMGMAAAVVLAAFLTAGVLDSLHFNPKLETGSAATGSAEYSNEVISILD